MKFKSRNSNLSLDLKSRFSLSKSDYPLTLSPILEEDSPSLVEFNPYFNGLPTTQLDLTDPTLSESLNPNGRFEFSSSQMDFGSESFQASRVRNQGQESKLKTRILRPISQDTFGVTNGLDGSWFSAQQIGKLHQSKLQSRDHSCFGYPMVKLPSVEAATHMTARQLAAIALSLIPQVKCSVTSKALFEGFHTYIRNHTYGVFLQKIGMAFLQYQKTQNLNEAFGTFICNPEPKAVKFPIVEIHPQDTTIYIQPAIVESKDKPYVIQPVLTSTPKFSFIPTDAGRVFVIPWNVSHSKIEAIFKILK